MSNPNGTMNRKIAEKLAQTQLDEAVANQRNAYLTKVGTSIAMHLDILLHSEHDKLSVLVGILSNLAVRGGGKWEELEVIMHENFQAQLLAAELAKKSQPPSHTIQAP